MGNQHRAARTREYQLTCLHSKCGTNSQDEEEDNEREQTGGRGAIARVCYRPNDDQKEKRAQELQRGNTGRVSY